MKIWDWKRQIDEKEIRQLAVCGFPGWDKRPHTEHDKNGNPSPHVHRLFIVDLGFVAGSEAQSRSVAVEWDSKAEGCYYYHDRTDTGSPIVQDGQLYRASFWFQWASDAQRFFETIGGDPNWVD